MTNVAAFFWGCAGSAAIELIEVYRGYLAEPVRFPERYKRVGFYVVRLLVVIVAGGMAYAHGTQTPVLAMQVGASAPLLLQLLSQRVPERPVA